MTNPIPANDDGLTWAGHLEELRARILWAAVAFLSLVFLFYGFSDDVLRALAQSAGGLVFTSPAGAFWARWIVTFWGAFFFSLPVLCWQAWRFTSSGLNSIERRLLWWGVPLAVVFFCGRGTLRVRDCRPDGDAVFVEFFN